MLENFVAGPNTALDCCLRKHVDLERLGQELQETGFLGTHIEVRRRNFQGERIGRLAQLHGKTAPDQLKDKFEAGFAAEQFWEIAETEGLNISTILITHGHSDHTGGAGRLKELTGAVMYAGAQDHIPGAKTVTDGQVIPLGPNGRPAFRA